jgi:hypothetical protein
MSLLLLLQWTAGGLLLGGSFFRGAIASEHAAENVDENGKAQVRFAADPGAERQADLEQKWGFEVRHFWGVVSSFTLLSSPSAHFVFEK